MMIWLIFLGIVFLPGISMGIAHVLYHVFGYTRPGLFGDPRDRDFFLEDPDGKKFLDTRVIRGDVIHLMGIFPGSLLFGGIACVIVGVSGLLRPAFTPFIGIAGVFIFIVSLGIFWKFRQTDQVIVGGLVIGLVLSIGLGMGIGWYWDVGGLGARAITGILIGVLYGGLMGSLGALTATSCLYAGLVIDKLVFFALVPPLLLLRYRTIICASCLRYTEPLQSRYDGGKRYCEFCQAEVEYTRIPGKVTFVFGNVALPSEPRQFVLENPAFGLVQADIEDIRSEYDLRQREQPVDVSDVYIDTTSCDSRLIERFLTFIVNFPPKEGLSSVQIFYRSELDDIGLNLNNALHNTFSQINPFI